MTVRRSDRFQAAWRDQRVIVTHNGRDFWNDRRFPLERTHGIAVLVGGIGPLFYVGVVFGNNAETWRRRKIQFGSGGELTIKKRDRGSGSIRTVRYRFTDGEVPDTWEE